MDSTDTDLHPFWKLPNYFTQDGTFVGPNNEWPVYRHSGDSAYYVARTYLSSGSIPVWKWRVSHNTNVGLPDADDSTVLSGYVLLDQTGVDCPNLIADARVSGVLLDDITVSCTARK